MATLILGANGKTGRLVVRELLEKQAAVKAIVRSSTDFYAVLPEKYKHDKRLNVVEINNLALSEVQWRELLKGCSSVISCLGHNLTFKGIYGKPRGLVADTVEGVCRAISSCSFNTTPVKFILMNTTGNQNKRMGEKVSLIQTLVVWLIRHLIPPHADNENASSYLQDNFLSNNKQIEWAVVRPDSLIDEADVTAYDVHQAPIRSAIFDAGLTSRVNVANFMATLAVAGRTRSTTNIENTKNTESSENIWTQWKFKMPVVYNQL